jgi:Skp family chaperone for outer membrane proteins
MKTMLKVAAFGAALAAPLAIATPALAFPPAAPAPAGSVNVGNVVVAVVDLDGAIDGSSAMQAAMQQIQTTYATQITAWRTRGQALQAELTPAQTEIQTLQGNAATPRATLEQKVAAYRTRAAAAQEELNRLSGPFALPRAYAQAQVAAQIEAALRAAMTAQHVTLVIKPEAVLTVAPGTSDLTAAVTQQLNTLVRTVSITPPAGWQPGQPVPGAAPAAGPQGR